MITLKRVSIILIGLTILYGSFYTVYGNEIDNYGNIRRDVYGICGIESSYEDVGYYDCYIPYKKSLYNIQGYSQRSYYDDALTSEDMTAMYRYLDSSLFNKKVGSIYGFDNSRPVSIERYYSGIEDGLFVYESGIGNKYYAISIPKFFYNYSDADIGWSEDAKGQLVDLIYVDGAVVHCVVGGLEWESTTNGWVSYIDTERNSSHCDVNYDQYRSLFSDSEGYTIKFFGDGDHLNIDDSELAYCRMYNLYIWDDEDRVERNKSAISEIEVDLITEESEDEQEPLFVSGDYLEQTGNETVIEFGESSLVASKFYSDETQKIVEAHCTDFNVTNYEEFMKKAGGYEKYLESLGGVFKKYAGDDKKIFVKDLTDFQELLDYVFGIVCIWGFDYSNGDPGHYGRWMSGDGVTEANVPKSAFYPSGYNIPYDYKDNWAEPRNVDLIASRKAAHGVTTCCNFTVDMIRNKLDEGCEYGYKDGKAVLMSEKGVTKIWSCGMGDGNEEGNASNWKYCKAVTKELSGVEEIKDINDLQPMDILQSPGHTTMIGLLHKEDGWLELINTGHDLTNDGNFIQKVNYKDGIPFSWFSGRRLYKLDNSTHTTEEEGNNLSSNSNLIVEEKDLVGMEGVMSVVSDKANDINIPDSSSLGSTEMVSLNSIKQEMKISLRERVTKFLRIFVVCLGLLLLMYVVIIPMCYMFDRANSIIDISLTKIVTFGRVEGYTGDYDKDRMSKREVVRVSLLCFFVSMFLISGGVYVWVPKFLGLFRG